MNIKIITGIMLLGAAAVMACTNPVFDYALRNWEAARYPVEVLHAQALSPEAAEWVKDLRARSEDANFFVALKAGADPGAGPLPSVQVFYPPEARIPRPAWSGPLSPDTGKQLAESPARKKLTEALKVRGAVPWILLTCGNAAEDQKARQQLQDLLGPLGTAITAEYAEEAVEAGIEEGGITITFPVVELSRSDAAETFFVSMLINSEPDLNQYSDMSMVFPVFGRARVLYALVGKGINEVNITKAARFLTGPCSCLIKEGNPGTDLLMTVNWVDHIEKLGSAVPEPPPPLPSAVDSSAFSGPVPPPAGIQPTASFVNVLIVSLVVLAFCVALGGIILYRRRSIP